MKLFLSLNAPNRKVWVRSKVNYKQGLPPHPKCQRKRRLYLNNRVCDLETSIESLGNDWHNSVKGDSPSFYLVSGQKERYGLTGFRHE